MDLCHILLISHPWNQKEEREETTLIQQQTRRPNLSSLQIPARSSECDLTSFTRIDVPSPGSARAGLPPRPNSARLISSVKNLIPQKSFRAKNLPPDAEKTVLIVPETPLSDKPSTSRSFSLNKILFSSSTKPAHSLPVTPKESAGPKPFEDRQLDDHSELPVSLCPFSADWPNALCYSSNCIFSTYFLWFFFFFHLIDFWSPTTYTTLILSPCQR